MCFLFFSQIICCLTVFISSGLAYNMDYQEEKFETQEFCYIFEDKNNSILAKITEFDENGNSDIFYAKSELDEITEQDKIYTLEHKGIPVRKMDEDILRLLSDLSDYSILNVQFRAEYNRITDTRKIPFNEIVSFYPPLYAYSDINETAVKSRDKIMLTPLFDKNGDEMPNRFVHLGESVNFNGDDYTCIGDYDYPFIPYYAMNDDFIITGIWMSFNDRLNSSDISRIRGIFDNVFQQNTTETFAPESYDPIERQINQMVKIISLAVMVIVLLAISKLYIFILENRQMSLYVFRLCGCSQFKIHLIYMLEIIISMLLSSILAFLIFRFVLFEPIAEMYPSFVVFFTPKAYAVLLALYLLIGMIIMTVTVRYLTRSGIIEMTRK